MTKAELVSSVAEQTGVSKKDTEAIIKQTFAEITKAMASKDSIQIAGFGTFFAGERAARTGRNPSTGKAIEIPASVVPKFKAAKGLKDALNS